MRSPSGTPATSTPTSSRSPPRCSGRRTPGPTGRCVDVIVDAAGMKGTGTWTVQSALSPRRTGQRHRRGRLRPRDLLPSGTARRRAGGAGGPGRHARGLRRRAGRAAGRPDPAGLRRRHPRRVVGQQGRRVRPGSGPHPHRSQGLRLGHRRRRGRQDLAGRAASSGPSCWSESAASTPRTTSSPCWRRRRSRPSWRAARTPGVGSWRRRRRRGCRCPGFSSALSYYDQARAPRLNAALTQGLRDFFGAHTYRRIDAEGSFHTLWSGDRTELAMEGSSH